jgi:hypothetical protein
MFDRFGGNHGIEFAVMSSQWAIQILLDPLCLSTQEARCVHSIGRAYGLEPLQGERPANRLSHPSYAVQDPVPKSSRGDHALHLLDRTSTGSSA